MHVSYDNNHIKSFLFNQTEHRIQLNNVNNPKKFIASYCSDNER